MKFADLAPNETVEDAIFSLGLLTRPWTWRRTVSKRLYDVMSHLFPQYTFTFFLSGRSALYHLLLSLKAKNTSVLLTGFTCSAVVTPVLKSGMIPLYADIETKSWGIDIQDLKRKWRSDTKAVIIQHTFGITPRDRKEIIDFARQKGAVIIEDLAHGFDMSLFGSRRSPRNNSPQSDYILTSFGRSKWISSVFGAALGHSPKAPTIVQAPHEKPGLFFLFRLLLFKPLIVLVKQTYHFYSFGRFLYALIRRAGFLLPELTRDEIAGMWNTYLDRSFPSVCEKLLLKQFETFYTRQKKQSAIAHFYNTGFGCKTLSLSTVSPRYPVLVDNKEQTIRDLSRMGVRAGRWYTQPIAPHGYPLEKAGYHLGDCPQSEFACAHLITLPLAVETPIAKQITRLVHPIQQSIRNPSLRPYKMST